MLMIIDRQFLNTCTVHVVFIHVTEPSCPFSCGSWRLNFLTVYTDVIQCQWREQHYFPFSFCFLCPAYRTKQVMYRKVYIFEKNNISLFVGTQFCGWLPVICMYFVSIQTYRDSEITCLIFTAFVWSTLNTNKIDIH